MKRITIMITTAEGELLERFTVEGYPGHATEIELARDVREHIERGFNCPDEEGL